MTPDIASIEPASKRSRGRPRFERHAGGEGLTGVEYRKYYQSEYYKLHPRKPKEPVEDTTGIKKRRGRPALSSAEERQERINQSKRNYYIKQRDIRKAQEREENLRKIIHAMLYLLESHRNRMGQATGDTN